MKRQKLNQQSGQLNRVSAQETRKTLEFGSVEDLLRHDALHTPVPPDIARRLSQSLRNEKVPARSWWHRLFGR